MAAAAADPREGVRGMQEIVKGVFTWSWFSEPHGYNFNGHLVRHAGGNICIDPVEPEAAVLHRLSREGVARIMLTNRNHARSAERRVGKACVSTCSPRWSPRP